MAVRTIQYYSYIVQLIIRLDILLKFNLIAYATKPLYIFENKLIDRNKR